MGLLNAEKSLRFFDRVIVELDPESFMKFIEEVGSETVVIHSAGKPMLSREVIHKYIVPYHGVLFFCRTKEELKLPDHIRIIDVKDFSYPGI